jgi:Na+/melibiose symporter-like transporter
VVELANTHLAMGVFNQVSIIPQLVYQKTGNPLSVPAGVVTLIILIVAIPSNFPNQGNYNYIALTWRQRLSRQSLSRLDISGAFLILGATLLLVAVLLEAGTSFAWNSATSIACLVVSAVMWILFLLNEKVLTNDQYRQEPIFPWRFISNRPWIGLLL